MACGTPVLATPVSGVPDVVREGEAGFLISEPSTAQLTSEIERILAQGDLATISESAQSLIEAEYSFQAAVERYEDLFRLIT
jgi:glycosyltransferase involved in cell wall biosynthesis